MQLIAICIPIGFLCDFLTLAISRMHLVREARIQTISLQPACSVAVQQNAA